MNWIQNKMPEEEDDYIVTIEGAEMSTWLHWDGISWTDISNTPYKIIAWCEFPPAFKRGKHGQQNADHD